MVRKILILSADRAERGLLAPIITELKQRNDVQVKFCELDVHNIVGNIMKLTGEFSWNPDILLVPTDRNEIVYAAAFAFHKGFILAHFHAGNNATGHPDDMNRRAISCFSHIMFCNLEEHKQNLIRLGEESWRIFTVGSTILDHIEIDESLCPTEPYDLVLLHPDPVSFEATIKDLRETIKEVRQSENIVWLAPNKDKNHEIIEDYLKSKLNYDLLSLAFLTFGNLPRNQFLGLLKNAKKCVGNSSSFLYELPTLNPKAEVIRIGHRNRILLPVTKIETGASTKIAEILATIPIDDKLRRKKIIL